MRAIICMPYLVAINVPLLDFVPTCGQEVLWVCGKEANMLYLVFLVYNTRALPCLNCHRAIFHAHFSPAFTTLSPTHSFTSCIFPLLSLFSTMFSCYRLAIRLTTLTNSYDLMTIPFILFLFFIHTLSFDEMRT